VDGPGLGVRDGVERTVVTRRSVKAMARPWKCMSGKAVGERQWWSGVLMREWRKEGGFLTLATLKNEVEFKHEKERRTVF
jgi:hypothetical protein